MRSHSRRLPLVAILGIVLAIGVVGCGDEPTPPVRKAFEPPPPPAGIHLRILDPGGRLFDHPAGFDVVWRDPIGAVHKVHRMSPAWSANPAPPSVDVAVLAPGCRPYEATFEHGEHIVRLEPGLPVTVEVLGMQDVPEEASQLELRLEHVGPVPGWWAASEPALLSAAAGWSERDEVGRRGGASVWPTPAALRLTVPVAGDYRPSWTVELPAGGIQWNPPSAVTIAGGDRVTVVLEGQPWRRR